MHLFCDKINKCIILLLNSCISSNKHIFVEFIIQNSKWSDYRRRCIVVVHGDCVYKKQNNIKNNVTVISRHILISKVVQFKHCKITVVYVTYVGLLCTKQKYNLCLWVGKYTGSAKFQPLGSNAIERRPFATY